MNLYNMTGLIISLSSLLESKGGSNKDLGSI